MLQIYATKHSGLLVADNATVRLDTLNEPQSDLLLMRENGQAHMDADGYICGVLEYLVWIADENRLLWWRLVEDEFVEIPADTDGLLASATFPGLVIDSKALTGGDLSGALARLA